jgi:predicted dithiol-disulfide oxidoreductase (DUF899 family)
VQHHQLASKAEWLEARRALLRREKEFTRLRDAINAERLALPWVGVEKDYAFDTPSGRRSLTELFDGRSQLMIYHFMFGPDWDAGCPGCSFMADHFDGTLPHLNNHDVTLVAVSRAPLARIEAYKKRMGWNFPWVSSFGSDFNADFQVSFTKEELASGSVAYNFTQTPSEQAFDELPGMSAFSRGEQGEVFHTYSSYARGLEDLVSTLMILDRAPRGRNETSTLSFVKRHDEYEEPARAHACCAA